MTDRPALERRLAELRAELGRVEGRPTEVYSRIVGYYRSVRNWNAGKREEHRERLNFGLPRALPAAPEAPSAPSPAAAGRAAAASPHRPLAEPALFEEGLEEAAQGLLVFTRAACPNCPPVKDYLLRAGLRAIYVDVDGEEGLALARRHEVLSTPTVLGLDPEGLELFRARSLAELRSRLGARAEPALV